MKSVRFQDLPLADRERSWDKDAAEARVRRWAEASDAPNAGYRKAFLWYDGDKADAFTAYKLPIADVIDGELKAVPRSDVGRPGAEWGTGRRRPACEGHLAVKRDVERYYEKIGGEAPFSKAA